MMLKRFVLNVFYVCFMLTMLSACQGWIVVPVEQAPVVTSVHPSVISATPSGVVPTDIPSPTTSSAPGRCINAAEYVADVTIPDGSILQSDEPFMKTWRVRNTGTCTWDSSYAIVFVNGTLFSISNAFAVAAAPGETTDISIPMRAPIYPGVYLSEWKLRASDGTVFGVGAGNAPLTVELSIDAGAENTVIAGFVYQDVNGNLQYDYDSDPLMANRTVQVQQGRCGVQGGVLASAVSGADGRYTVTGTFSGDICVMLLGDEMTEHVIDLVVPAGSSYHAVDLRSAMPTALISGYVWNDSAQPDGIRQPGEAPFTGAVVLIAKGACDSAQSVPYAATADGEGFFQFRELYGGTYCVSMDANERTNAAVLGSGAWTTPNIQQIFVAPGLEAVANFGWQAQ